MINLENKYDWRFERKFMIAGVSKYEVEDIIKYHPAMFVEIFHLRNINNIYLDTYAHTNFFKNVDGQSQRIKVRVRWYGELFGEISNPVLEFKIKSGQLGRKVSFKLPCFNLDNNLTNSMLHKIFNKSELPDAIKIYLKDFDYTLINRYSRRYYQTSDKKYRVTMDFNMRYIKLLSHQENNYLEQFIDDRSTILELKYLEEYDETAGEITNYFPFRMTKSSKYITGIENYLTSIS